jgi:6-pyruvoyltetrahydropterin/6-carboxytetrahydropterin synthase
VFCTRIFGFDSGHRVLGHENKCKYLHGHRYTAHITTRCSELDYLGRVLDFGEIKELFSKWIDMFWDHNMILHPSDPLLQLSCALAADIFNRNPYIMPDCNPTVENLARVLLQECDRLVREIQSYPELRVSHVRLYETPNCYSDYPNPTL